MSSVYHGGTKARVVATLNLFKPPSKAFTDRSKAVLLLWFTISVFACISWWNFYTPPHNSGGVLRFHVGRP